MSKKLRLTDLIFSSCRASQMLHTGILFLRILLKCSFWLSRSGVEGSLSLCNSNKLPDDVGDDDGATGPRTTLNTAGSPWPQATVPRKQSWVTLFTVIFSPLVTIWPILLKQWFSTGSSCTAPPLPNKGHWANVWRRVGLSQDAESYWNLQVNPRGAAKHSAIHVTVPEQIIIYS